MSIVVTKRGKPVARLVPVHKGSVVREGDLLQQVSFRS